MNEARLEHKTIKIGTLIAQYRAGQIVIPEFQRDYVWKPRQAPKLIDSLYCGFPISSLLVWQSPDQIQVRRSSPRPTRSGTIGWLIDGQQRVITLSRIFAGDEGIDVLFNPDLDQFQLANAANRQDSVWVRLSDVWDDDLYRSMRRSLDGGRSDDKREEKFERVRKILDYEVPVVYMVDHKFENAVDAFTRINTLGVKLKAADIESARVAAKHSGFIREEVIPFLDGLQKKGFSRITIMHLFRACAFIATPDGRTRTPLHELERKAVLAAWKRTTKATEQIVSLIRGELGLMDMNLLWSGALLVPLVIIQDKSNPKERNPKEMIGWLGLAAMLHRYSVSSDTQLDQDMRACRSLDPIRGLLNNLRQLRAKLSAQPSDFSGALNDRGGLFAAYIACNHRGALDFFTGGKMHSQDSVDRHHILPRGQFPTADRSKADMIANIAFVTSAVNRSIGQSGPEVYLKSVAAEVLTSQCVPTEVDLWAVDKASDFFKKRRELLSNSFNEFLNQSFPNRRLGKV